MTARKDEQEPARKCIPPARPPDIMGDDRVLLAWQRSHMSNERTFLAWCRTAIALLAFGFVVEKFEVFLHHLLRLEGSPVDATPSSTMVYLSLGSFVLAAIAISLSGIRFLRVRRHINQGEASFSILPDILVIVSVIAIIIIAIVLSIPRLLDIGTGNV
jgi:putative membrane protein